MTLAPLDNLVEAALRKREKPDQAEFDGLCRSGAARLRDSGHPALSPDGRFDLAYNAAHALSLAALRWHGYRPDNRRYIVFQALEITLGLSAEKWRVLDKAHRQRNLAAYEGRIEIVERLLTDLAVAQIVAEAVARLGPVPGAGHGPLGS